MTAARRFSKSLQDLPAVPVTDWELLARLEELFRPYVPRTNTSGGHWMFTARDSRGEYTAPTLTDLREEVEKQEEPPEEVRLYVDDAGFAQVGGGPSYELGVNVRSDVSRALLYSTDEPMVNHMATRLRELFAQAARRAEAREHGLAQNGSRLPEQYPVSTAEEPESETPEPPFWHRHVTPLLVTIAGGVVASVIAGVILYLLFGP